MDARTRKLAGWAIAAVGLIIAIIGLLADQIGLGSDDDASMGGRQLAALIVGVVILAAGVALALWRRPSSDASTEASTSASTTP